MPPRFTVKVTEEDIDRAIRSDSYNCVVAQAVARAIPNAHHIEVDTQLIRFTHGTGERYGYLTPYSVQGYVVAFDAGDPIRPFEFQLRNGMVIRRRTDSKGAQPEAGCDICGQIMKRGGIGPHKRLKHGVTKTDGKKPQARLEKAKPGTVKAPPRVFKTGHRTKQRTYGHRVLRINQPKDVHSEDEVSA
jgi:hypothetical protein